MFGVMRKRSNKENIFSFVDAENLKYVGAAKSAKGFFRSPYQRPWDNNVLEKAWLLYINNRSYAVRQTFRQALVQVAPSAFVNRDHTLYDASFKKFLGLKDKELYRLRASLVPQIFRKHFRTLKDQNRDYPATKPEYERLFWEEELRKRLRIRRQSWVFDRNKLLSYCKGLLPRKKAGLALKTIFEDFTAKIEKKKVSKWKKRFIPLNRASLKVNDIYDLDIGRGCNFRLVLKQLIGMHAALGHLMENSLFLARWFLYGVYPAKSLFKLPWVVQGMHDVFIIDLVNTFLTFRSLLLLGRGSGFGGRAAWFICYKEYFAPLTAIYAVLCGSGYSTISWIPGSLTNFKKLAVLFYSLYLNWCNGLVIPKRHYSFLFRFFQFKLLGTCVPSFVFFFNIWKGAVALKEVGGARISSVAVVDSDADTSYVDLPLPSNDDSMLSINFFSYLTSHMMLSGSIIKVKRFKYVIRNFKRVRFLFILYYLLLFFVKGDFDWFNKRFKGFIFKYRKGSVFKYDTVRQYLFFVDGNIKFYYIRYFLRGVAKKSVSKTITQFEYFRRQNFLREKVSFLASKLNESARKLIGYAQFRWAEALNNFSKEAFFEEVRPKRRKRRAYLLYRRKKRFFFFKIRFRVYRKRRIVLFQDNLIRRFTRFTLFPKDWSREIFVLLFFKNFARNYVMRSIYWFKRNFYSNNNYKDLVRFLFKKVSKWVPLFYGFSLNRFKKFILSLKRLYLLGNELKLNVLLRSMNLKGDVVVWKGWSGFIKKFKGFSDYFKAYTGTVFDKDRIFIYYKSRCLVRDYLKTSGFKYKLDNKLFFLNTNLLFLYDVFLVNSFKVWFSNVLVLKQQLEERLQFFIRKKLSIRERRFNFLSLLGGTRVQAWERYLHSREAVGLLKILVTRFRYWRRELLVKKIKRWNKNKRIIRKFKWWHRHRYAKTKIKRRGKKRAR